MASHIFFLRSFRFFLKQFERYFAANDVSKGGSFYLQSKIYRAHELLIEFQKEKRQEEQSQGSSDSKQEQTKE
jgi:import inner membrane translocase subunit TIM16